MAIKICVTPDRWGNLSLSPVSDRVKKRVAKTNHHNGEGTVFLQAEDPANDFLKDLRPVPRRQIKAGWETVVVIDEWTYRHLCGGQVESTALPAQSPRTLMPGPSVSP